MNYMLLIYTEEARMEQELKAPEAKRGCDGLAERLKDAGKYISAGILQPISTATSVQVRSGKRFVTDGPFAETREQLAGFLMVEARDLDEAIDIATQHPVVKYGTVEIRPVFEIPFLD